MKRLLLLASLALVATLPSCHSPQTESVASAPLTAAAQTSVYYETPAFSAVFPPGTVVQVKQTTGEGTAPLVWNYYQGVMPNDARLVVGYADIDPEHSPPELSNTIDAGYNSTFVPGYSVKKGASRLDTLPAVSAVASGFGQGSETVQCHQCTTYESHVVVAWDKSRRRFWMLQTLAAPNELSSEEAVKFLNSFKVR
jgi:hypothetical protein